MNPAYFWFIPLGIVVGTYGTLVGAGGGFVLVPILLALKPTEDPNIITSISLAVVFFNALSGTAAYARRKRIDYGSGLFFALATVPGAVLGAFAVHHISRQAFDRLFGIGLILVAAFIILYPKPVNRRKEAADKSAWTRTVVDAHGHSHTFSFNKWLGEGISFFVGFVSSLLGIGGGIIHVPALIQLLNFPPHIATATSHFILAIMALAGTVVHIATGAFYAGFRRTILLSIGVVIGAQIGARLSERLRSTLMLRLLAAALGLVGIRLLFVSLGG